jgi:hypothetical protein
VIPLILANPTFHAQQGLERGSVVFYGEMGFYLGLPWGENSVVSCFRLAHPSGQHGRKALTLNSEKRTADDAENAENECVRKVSPFTRSVSV